MAGFHLDTLSLETLRYNPEAEPVFGDWWSGWAWPTTNGKWCLLWRGQGDGGATLIELNSIDAVNQYCDGLEGDTDEFIRD